MDVLDSQVHLGPGGASEMVAAMDALGIRSVLVDEWWHGALSEPGQVLTNGAIRVSAPTTELAARMHPGRFGYLLRVYPDDPEHRAVVRLAADAPYCRALRLAVITRPDLARFAEGSHDGIFAEASAGGLPLFVTIPGHTELVERYALKFPEARIVICHCGMPPDAGQVPGIVAWEGLPDSEAYWRPLSEQPAANAFAKVLESARLPNVALKWAHAPAYFGAGGYPNEGVRPFLRQAIDHFGAERVMWASDFTTNQTGETWAELLFAVRENPDLSTEEKSSILGRSARSWLNWAD